ncbi:hypothetical protein ES705_18883 [subsurface metagenome]
MIGYAGNAHTNDPGEWIVDIADLRTGLFEVNITIYTSNGGIESTLLDQNFNGITSKSYTVPVPPIEGVYRIVVIATNNDPTGRDTSTKTETIEIEQYDPSGLPPVIIG